MKQIEEILKQKQKALNMKQIEEILKQKQKALDEMTYIDRKISAIDEGVRNRAYTAQEEKDDEELEAEKDKKRKRFEELEEELVEELQNPQKAREVQESLRKKKRELLEEAINSCDRIDLYITWLKEAELKLTERNREDDELDR